MMVEQPAVLKSALWRVDYRVSCCSPVAASCSLIIQRHAAPLCRAPEVLAIMPNLPNEGRVDASGVSHYGLAVV